MKWPALFIAIALLPLTSLGQSEMEKRELPRDLLIRFSSNSRGRPPGGSYAVTIDRDGRWFYEGFRGYHIGKFTAPELRRANAERLRKLGLSSSDKLVDRLSKADLAEIVKEFDAIDFFNLGPLYSYGQTDPKTGNLLACATHQEEETIYIRANGREKSVENYTGCGSEKSVKLTALGEMIRKKLKFR